MSSLSIRRSDLVVKEGWDEKKVLATLKEVGAVPGNAVVFVNLLEEMSQRKLLLGLVAKLHFFKKLTKLS